MPVNTKAPLLPASEVLWENKIVLQMVFWSLVAGVVVGILLTRFVFSP
jgi:MFS superfamily sulfate permease-like transporter